VYNDLSVIEFMSRFQSWPLLRRLEITGLRHDLQLVEKIIRGAPNLQELTLCYFNFKDSATLKSLATVVCNDPSADLKWHLNFCKLHQNTIVIWEEIVTWEKAKLMRISFEVRDAGHCKVLQAIMSEYSCVGDLNLKFNLYDNYGGGFDGFGYGLDGFGLDPVLKQMLQVLHASANLITSLEFNIKMHKTV